MHAYIFAGFWGLSKVLILAIAVEFAIPLMGV